MVAIARAAGAAVFPELRLANFVLSQGEQFRILDSFRILDTSDEIGEELVERRFNAVFTLEPLDP